MSPRGPKPRMLCGTGAPGGIPPAQTRMVRCLQHVDLETQGPDPDRLWIAWRGTGAPECDPPAQTRMVSLPDRSEHPNRAYAWVLGGKGQLEEHTP